jgi:hypothetical protein
MRKLLYIFLLVAFAGYPSAGGAPLELHSGEYIQADGAPLSVAIMSAPTVADWNSDGKKDLVVGQFSEGKIRLFTNLNTHADPVFGSGAYIQSAGSDITTSYG